MTFYYVYILQSVKYPDKYYTGHTDDLNARVKDHNLGKCKYTSKYIPWKIKTAIAFTNRERALKFERYLKSQSGRAFAKKRL